jgi:hypothetical protein
MKKIADFSQQTIHPKGFGQGLGDLVLAWSLGETFWMSGKLSKKFYTI